MWCSRCGHAAGRSKHASGRVVEFGAGKVLETVALPPGDQDLAITKQCCRVVGSHCAHVANCREVACGRGSGGDGAVGERGQRKTEQTV